MNLIGVFFLAWGISLATTPLVRSAARRTGFVSRLSSERWNTRPVALLGGTAIFLACLVPVWLLSPPSSAKNLIVSGGFAMFLLGLLDDLVNLSAGIRLIVESLIALYAVHLGWIAHLTPYPWLDCAITILWIVGITNSMNLLDNMDGAAAGIAAVAAIGFLAISLPHDLAASGVASAAVIGSCIGFLQYNRKPASIYMGDSGSLFLGYQLAILSIAATRHPTQSQTGAFVPALLIMGLACFDTLLVSVLRLHHGRMPWHGGRDHVSHRIALLLHHNERRAILALYGIGTAGAVLGFLAAQCSTLPRFSILGGAFAGFLMLGLKLRRVPCYQSQTTE